MDVHIHIGSFPGATRTQVGNAYSYMLTFSLFSRFPRSKSFVEATLYRKKKYVYQLLERPFLFAPYKKELSYSFGYIHSYQRMLHYDDEGSKRKTCVCVCVESKQKSKLE